MSETTEQTNGPKPISLTARESDILKMYRSKRAAAARAMEEAQGVLEALCLVIAERAGDLNVTYRLNADSTALLPEGVDSK